MSKLKYSDDLEVVNLLANKYGHFQTLQDIKDIILATPLGYECPKCKGEGTYKVSKNVYPSGLPDSGWVFEQGWIDKKCDCCNGKGFTIEPIIEMYTIAGSKKTISGYCTEDGSKTWDLPEKGDEPF